MQFVVISFYRKSVCEVVNGGKLKLINRGIELLQHICRQHLSYVIMVVLQWFNNMYLIVFITTLDFYRKNS